PMPFREPSADDPAIKPAAVDPPASATLLGTGANAAATAAAVSAASDFGSDDDHDLAIGEVSRVVSLGDIVRSGRTERSAADRSAVQRRSGQVPVIGRSTGMIPSVRTPGALPVVG